MYYVDSYYRKKTKEEIHQTLEEAVIEAEDLASRDHEGYHFYVNKIEVYVVANPPKNPVKTLEVTAETVNLLIEEDKKNENY